MKPPHPLDPNGDIESAVRQQVLLHILFLHGVSLKLQGDGTTLMTKDSCIFAVVLPDAIGGLMVKRIARIFDIDPLEFYTYTGGLH